MCANRAHVERVCTHPDCETRLSRYNRSDRCMVHDITYSSVNTYLSNERRHIRARSQGGKSVNRSERRTFVRKSLKEISKEARTCPDCKGQMSPTGNRTDLDHLERGAWMLELECRPCDKRRIYVKGSIRTCAEVERIVREAMAIDAAAAGVPVGEYGLDVHLRQATS